MDNHDSTPHSETTGQPSHRHWLFSLSTLLLCLLVISLSALGGCLGVAAGLGQNIAELSPDNQQFSGYAGMFVGILPAAISGSLARHCLQNRLATLLVSSVVAVLAPALALLVVTAAIADC